MADLVTIKKIKTIDGTSYDIDAKYWDGHSYSEITDAVHGVVDTFVIPVSSGTVYNKIVGKTDNSITLTKTELDSLVDDKPIDSKYKVGDIILIKESTTEDKIVFDRWVSGINGDNVELTVLETQVATHHHTIGVSKSNALIGVSASTQTATIPVVGSAVSVVTSVTGDFITSVSMSGGNDTLSLTSASGEGSVAHSHNIDGHTHTITIKPSALVKDTVDVYTTLTSKTYTPHTHATETVAGVQVNGEEFSYINGGNTDTFIKTLTDSDEQTTGAKELTTQENNIGLSTSTQVSGNKTGASVKTESSGSHSHTATVKTNSNVVTDVTLASKVVTSVDYSAGTIQPNVVTAVTTSDVTVITSWKNAETSSFVNSWACSVDNDGVLSFDVSSANAVTDATKVSNSDSKSIKVVNTVSSASQTSPSLTAPTADQTHDKSDVELSITIDNAGGHTHGFTHTHNIDAHTHSITEHTHTYVKSVANATGDAYISLTSAKHTPHSHTSTTVAAISTASTPLTYIESGSTTNVVSSLISSDHVLTTTSTPLTTDSKYVKLEGEITFPGLTTSSASVAVSTQSITPAAEGSEKAIKSITFTSGGFVTGLTSGSDKTSVNIGGK